MAPNAPESQCAPVRAGNDGVRTCLIPTQTCRPVIASWMARSDLTTQIVDFIALAEAEFNRVLRVRQMEQRSTATAAEYMALPTGFLELRDIQLNTTPKVSLELVSASQMENYSSASGQPLAYCIMANQIQLAPVPDGTYTVEIDYYEVVPPLASNSTNWMLTSYPDAYLYGSLAARGGLHSGCESGADMAAGIRGCVAGDSDRRQAGTFRWWTNARSRSIGERDGGCI